nr:hypothetical protein [Tanacetum cinerariifolium]
MLMTLDLSLTKSHNKRYKIMITMMCLPLIINILSNLNLFITHILLNKIESVDMNYDSEQIDQNDEDIDLAKERELLASLIAKLKCEIDKTKNRNTLLETSNKGLVEKLKSDIADFKNKNKSLTEANNKLSMENDQLYADYKKSKEELKRRITVEYASEMELECAKVRGDLLSNKMEYKRSSEKYTHIINGLNQTVSELKEKLSAHQDTISILKQQKDAPIKLFKTREYKEIEKVIDLENKVKVLDNIVYKTGQSVQTMNMLNNKCRTSFAKPEYLKKAKQANPRLYDIGCYNDNLALMLSPETDEVIRLEKEKLSRISHINAQKEKRKESFQKQTIFLETRMNEYMSGNKKCQSSFEIKNIRRDINTIVTGVELCKQKIANPTWYGHVEPVVKNTIEQNVDPVISKINVGLHIFLKRLNEEMVADLRYFNSLESEVDSLTSQLETQKTQFVNEINRLSREYYYANHMNAILGVYTELDKVTNLQCDYLELLQKCKCLKTELSKRKKMSKSFESVQKHAINLELELK